MKAGGAEKEVLPPGPISTRCKSSLPIATESTAQASASRNVDLPDPFSPTKNVTGVVKSSFSIARTTGRLKGNPLLASGRSFTVRDLKCTIFMYQ